jgi:hypothetical protein
MSNHKQFNVVDERFVERPIRTSPRWIGNRYVEWALTVFCWDVLMPFVVILVPITANLMFPQQQVVAGTVSIFCTLIAYTIRFLIGWIKMRTGQLYIWQGIIFIVAVSLLFVLETIILTDQFRRGPRAAGPIALLKMFLIYLALMGIAMFPFRKRHVVPQSVE